MKIGTIVFNSLVLLSVMVFLGSNYSYGLPEVLTGTVEAKEIKPAHMETAYQNSKAICGMVERQLKCEFVLFQGTSIKYPEEYYLILSTPTCSFVAYVSKYIYERVQIGDTYTVVTYQCGNP